MPQREPKEKREFVRTDLSIRATLMLLDKDSAEGKRYPNQRLFVDPPGDLPPIDATGFSETGIADLSAVLFQINEKLDRVLQIIGGSPSDADRIEVLQTLNVSGSGVGMLVNRPMVLGQRVEISLSIPEFPMGIFSVQGEVIHIKKKKGDVSDLYEVGLKFLDITEEQRDRLIGFIFRQQRKSIRQRKNYL